MEFFSQSVVPYFNYWAYVILMMIGMHAMITKNNLIKKLIGMTIFQTAIILLYVSIGVKAGATIPILEPLQDGKKDAVAAETSSAEKTEHSAPVIDPDRYGNPLPHVLMLTAIVVGVSTLGVGLAIAQSVYRNFHSLEEDEILAKIKQGGAGVDV